MSVSYLLLFNSYSEAIDVLRERFQLLRDFWTVTMYFFYITFFLAFINSVYALKKSKNLLLVGNDRETFPFVVFFFNSLNTI